MYRERDIYRQIEIEIVPSTCFRLSGYAVAPPAPLARLPPQ